MLKLLYTFYLFGPIVAILLVSHDMDTKKKRIHLLILVLVFIGVLASVIITKNKEKQQSWDYGFSNGYEKGYEDGCDYIREEAGL